MSELFIIVNFYDRINYIYNLRKISAAKLQDKTGISRSYVYKILNTNGPIKISRMKLEKLAEVLSVDIHWLETGEGEPFLSQVAEERAAYSTTPETSELLALLSQLDASDRSRILQEAKDRLLLKQIRERENRTRGSGTGDDSTVQPKAAKGKKGRRETA